MSAASSMNILGAFCGKRDVPALTRECLKERYSFEEADVMVLFGASVLAGGEVLAGAMKAGAAIFDEYLRLRHGLRADFLETESTNCGNNITNLLALIDKEQIPCRSIILSQDAAMQRRMEAGLMLHRPGLTVVNYAVYSAEMRKNSSDARCGSSGGG